MPEEGNVSTETSTETKTELVEPVVEPTVESKKEDGTFDREYVESLRGEAASWRTKLRDKENEFKEMQAQLKEFADSKLSAEEKLNKEFEEAKTKAHLFEAKARENALALQIALAAKEEKITDVKAAVKLADRELIEYDDNGQVTNLQTVFEHLKQEYSSLFSSSANAPNVSSTNPSRPSKPGKKYTSEDLKKMSPEKINELREKGDLNHLLGIH